MLSFWIVSGWVRELSVVVFFAQLLLSRLSDDDKLICVLLVCEIFIEIILEMLNHVHVLLHEIVSSDSIKRECLIIKIVCVNSKLWVESLFLQFVVNSDSAVVILLIEGS